jgi:hypothetical protein
MDSAGIKEQEATSFLLLPLIFFHAHTQQLFALVPFSRAAGIYGLATTST